MGQQQILLLVLSVVIIATTIAVSIDQFNTEIKKANRQAIIQDMYNLAYLAIAFSKTPASLGGGGGDWNVDRFYAYSGYATTPNGKRLVTKNGQIKVTSNAKGKLIINGYGTEIGLDDSKVIRARIKLTDANDEEGVFTLLN
jgi:hypothetical protein